MQMVLSKFGISRNQCELANVADSINGCHESDVSASSIRWDQPLSVTQFTAEYARYGIASSFHDGPVSYEEVQSELGSDRPVQVGIEWSLGGHAVVIVGWEESPDGRYLLVNWPRLAPTDASAAGSILYEELLSPNDDVGTWKWSWTGIEAR
jgi:hypothetical protein